MSLPTPNYVLINDVSLYGDRGRDKSLKAGSFVRPIELVYIPQHILEDASNKHFDKDIETFCYTRFGIFAIKNSNMRKI